LIYLFDDFALDTDRRELRRGTVEVHVEPQVFELLVYLVRNRERVVSRDDLLAAIWNGRYVSESALSTRINAVRSAIGDSGKEQRLIRTLPRKGVRFVGVVREQEKLRAFGAAEPLPPNRPSIAVLPFQNLSADPDQQYFADGLVEDLTTALTRLRWIFVLGRNLRPAHTERNVDVKQVGHDLGVRYLLLGSVRRGGNRVRVNSQLLDVSTGAQLWAESFEGTFDRALDLQDIVATKVVAVVSQKLEQAEIERVGKPANDIAPLDAPHYLPVTKPRRIGPHMKPNVDWHPSCRLTRWHES
jgi:TolB-like protein